MYFIYLVATCTCTTLFMTDTHTTKNKTHERNMVFSLNHYLTQGMGLLFFKKKNKSSKPVCHFILSLLTKINFPITNVFLCWSA